VNEDARDEQLAEALAVPPLDDVTRRRLVRAALDAVPAESDESEESDEAQPPRVRQSWAPLVAAAVVILLVVVGVLALGGGGGGNDSTDTAARKADRAPAAETPSAADSSRGAAASLVPGTADLGDLGDLSGNAARDRARRAVTAEPLAAPIAGSSSPAVPTAEKLLQDVADASCADALHRSGTTVVGVGSATVDGNAAIVVVAERDGVRAPYLLVLHPCSLHPL
jgi:hypothetical protein